MAKKKDYGLGAEASLKKIAAPNLPYQPRDPKHYRPNIGLIACGGITEQHLKAYRKAGYSVIALCDPDISRAEARRKQFYPKASVHSDYRDLFKRDDIQVLDIATHPHERHEIVEQALLARKHVLSQKPFTLDLSKGERLMALARKQNVKLAVNQNGRWAPHFSYIRQAIGAGLLGRVMAAHLSVHWDHGWIKGTPFEDVRHIVLYDFAIHWFDILSAFMNRPARRVYASFARSPSQQARPNLLAQALIEYDDAQATLSFDADTKFGPQDRTIVIGTEGTASSIGKSLTQQKVTLHTRRGVASPKLKGSWFPDGFHGTMAELLCAIEENREPDNSAAGNLASLGLCFAAVASAESREPQTPGQVRSLPA